jgi:hypothetical protein
VALLILVFGPLPVRFHFGLNVRRQLFTFPGGSG